MLMGLTLLFGYICHLIFSRITSQRYVYLTGHMIWVHAGGFAIFFHSLGLSDVATVAVASVVDGAVMSTRRPSSPITPATSNSSMGVATGTVRAGFRPGTAAAARAARA